MTGPSTACECGHPLADHSEAAGDCMIWDLPDADTNAVWKCWCERFRAAALHVEVVTRTDMTDIGGVPVAGPTNLVPLTLVPVEVFGGDCDCHNEHNYRWSADTGRGASNGCDGWGYGLMDAVQAWSDCNRASGRIYRVEDLDGHREPGESITVYVEAAQVEWFQKRFGDNPDQLSDQRCHTCGQTRQVLVEVPYIEYPEANRS